MEEQNFEDQDRDSNFLVAFSSCKAQKSYWERKKEWLTDVGYNSWWHMKCAQHAAYNPKFEKILIEPAW